LEGIKKDFEKASKVYRSNCDDYGYAKSCLKFGNYSILGKGKSSTTDKGDPKQAYNYYEKGCELKDPDCCLHSGLIMVSKTMPPSIKSDPLKGVDLLTKSCELNNGTACFYLSGMYINGVTKSTDKSKSTQSKDPSDIVLLKDMKKAYEYGVKACDLNNMYACANVAQMFMRGDGIAKDDKKAEFFKKKAQAMQDEVRKQQAELKFQQGLD
jgi:cytochrome c oxidase assembly factor 7